jgi:hypothetical protein
VNHAELTSIYPPLALWWFRAVAAFGRGLPWLQLCTAVVDAATAVVLSRVAPRGYAWLYALHPLPVLESAAGAHLEALALAVTAPALLGERRAPAWIALGAWVKLLPGLFWPVAMRGRSTAAKIAWTAAAAAGAVALAVPVLSAGPALWTSARVYAETWTFNGLIYPPLHALVGAWARPLLALAGLAMVVAANLRAPDLARAWLWIGLAFLATTPTAHPWYGLWVLVPAIALGRPGIALGTVALLGGYGVLSTFEASTGGWTEPGWLWALTWLPALAALALERLPASDATPTAA